MLQLHRQNPHGFAFHVPGFAAAGFAGFGAGAGGGGMLLHNGEAADPPSVRQMRVQEIVDELTMAGRQRSLVNC